MSAQTRRWPAGVPSAISLLRVMAISAALTLGACATYGAPDPNARGTVFSTDGSAPQTSFSYGFRGPPDIKTAERYVTDNGVVVFIHPDQCLFSLVYDDNRVQFLNTTIVVDGKEYVSPTFVIDQPGLSSEMKTGLARRVFLFDSSSMHYCGPATTSRELLPMEKLFYEYKKEAVKQISLAMIEYAVRSNQVVTEQDAAQLFAEMGLWGTYIREWHRRGHQAIIDEGHGQVGVKLEKFARPVPSKRQ